MSRSPRRAVVAAPFWRRVLADLIDLGILIGAGLGLRKAGGAFSPDLPPNPYGLIDHAADLLADHLHLFRGSAVLALVMGLLYAVIFRQILGRTPGEWALGLRLVDRDGLDVGPLESLLHSLGTVLGLGLLLVGYLWAAVDLKRQGLAEYLSRTLLIRGAARIERPQSTAAPTLDAPPPWGDRP